MKRHTTPPRRHSRQSVLEVRVMSPRIAWFGFLKYAGMLAKIACCLGLVAGLGWGAWRGTEKAFYKNPDFRLRVITLNANPVIDELGVAAAAGINLAANPNMFDIDVQDVIRKLKCLPAIADAHVERHLPGTLAVAVIPRTPVAWISCPASGLTETRRPGNLLVDHAGVAYPCPDRQLEFSATLPVIELPPAGGSPLKVGEKIRQPELANCCLLLDAARNADPDGMQWIESVKQVNEWSLLLVTRQGTAATFGLGDHTRQIESLRAALDHAGEKGYLIDTINLIPKYNIPITLRTASTPPRTASTPPRTASTAPRAEPAALHAEPTPPKHPELAALHAEPGTKRAEPGTKRAETTTKRAETSIKHTAASPPRAIPVTQLAERTPPRAILVAAQATPRGHQARRTGDSGNKSN